MIARKTYLFHPEKIFQMGIALIGLLFFCTIPFFSVLFFSELPAGMSRPKKQPEPIAPISFTLGLLERPPTLPMLGLQEEISFSLDPLRPDSGVGNQRLRLSLNMSRLCKQITLPCRLNLFYQNGCLALSDVSTPFWLEIYESGSPNIQVKAFVASKNREKVEAGTFSFPLQEVPVLPPEKSIFKQLAEAKYWGIDLFKEQYAGCRAERLEMGELIELAKGDLLAYAEGKWQKICSLEEGRGKPIARLQASNSKGLIFEGWGGDEYVRFLIPTTAESSPKLKGDEVLTAVRVRSEKQISCMLEKQCLVLKTGDWVLKSKGRWKVLRRKEDRDAYLNTKLVGDLFVFDHIQMKQGQKIVQGRLFNMSRTQVVSVEALAQQTRKLLRGKL